MPYVNDLRNVIDMEAIRSAGAEAGRRSAGRRAEPYWEPINSVYGLESTW